MADHIDDPSSPVKPTRDLGPPSRADDDAVSDTSRWLAAAAYLFVLAIFVLYEAKQRARDDFLRFHARQGFVLFFVEFSLVVVSTILQHTVGGIPVLGAVITITFNLTFGLLAVGVSIMGFMYALSGERWHLPVLGAYANRVPLS